LESQLHEALFLDTPILAPGLQKEWLAEGRILCYRAQNTERATIDACLDDLVSCLSDWPADRPILMLLDFRAPQAIISAYLMHRAKELAEIYKHVHGKFALLTSHRGTAQIASMALRAIARGQGDRLIFADEARAIAWLLHDETIAQG
jgi:hypothetical protein